MFSPTHFNHRQDGHWRVRVDQPSLSWEPTCQHRFPTRGLVSHQLWRHHKNPEGKHPQSRVQLQDAQEARGNERGALWAWWVKGWARWCTIGVRRGLRIRWVCDPIGETQSRYRFLWPRRYDSGEQLWPDIDRQRPPNSVTEFPRPKALDRWRSHQPPEGPNRINRPSARKVTRGRCRVSKVQKP